MTGSPPSDYIVREALISAAINGAISAGFAWFVFGGYASVPLWGRAGFVFDFIPQGFMIGLMGSLVPSLLLRRNAAREAWNAISDNRKSSRTIFLTAVCMAMIASAGSAGLMAVLFWITAAPALPFPAALAVKVVFGGALGASVTVLSLMRMCAILHPPGS